MFTNHLKRNRDLMAAISREMASAGGVGLDEAVARAATSPAPAYYITFETALRQCQRIRTGSFKPSGRHQTLWVEFSEKVSDTVDRSGCSLPAAVARVLATQGASSFFITPRRALDIYREIKRNS